MATTIKLKNGSGAPLAGDLVQGEPALDLTNKRLYSEDSGGTVIEIGTNPSTIDINAGTIDGTVIGGASAAAGTFTNLTATGSSTITDATCNVVTYSLNSTNSSATTTLDFGANSSHIVTLVGAATFAFSNVAAGQTGVIILKQDATGGHSFTLPATAKTPKGGAAITQVTTANTVSVLSYSVLDTSNVLVNYIGDFA